MKSILIVEDEQAIARVLAAYLRKAGFDVRHAADGPTALTLFDSDVPALVLLDVMLPGMDGWDLLRLIREKSPCPVIMLTALDDIQDRLNGLNAGADDYMSKPFMPEEVVARVNAVLRRNPHWTAEGEGKRYFGNLVIDLAGVTHELKTPVTSIKGLVMAVRDDIVSPQEGKEFLDIALKESERMERMVADLLDYNAMSAGSVAVRHERIDLNLLVGEIIYQWKIAYEDQSPEVALHVRAGTLYTIGDALRIQQIIVNLLNNGLQATASGQTTLFDIRLRAEEQYLFVDVQDNGTGIAEEDRSKIFERFYRGEIKKRRTRGLGLGLTYSRLLAQAQGGDLTLTSSSPKGSQFTLKLPRWKSPDATTLEKAYRSPVNA